MCGIAGILNYKTNKKVDETILRSMNNLLTHRGPDDDGYHIGSGIGLAHRRLSIIDLSGGKQPIYNEDKEIVIVFNGEIYNFLELRNELEKHGHKFRTKSDTEVIIHAWEQWGKECVLRLRGMFAFAIWDNKKQILFLARDRLGIKPLFYTKTLEDELIFGSELKAIEIYPGVSKKINPLAIEDYFALGYIPDPKTIYSDIYKLPPGHTLIASRHNNTLQIEKYWDVPFNDEFVVVNEDILAEELISKIKEAIKIRMISEVPLGAFLSGGVDSSTVVALMASMSEQSVNTCSILFNDKRFNEENYSHKVAKKYNTKHHFEKIDIDENYDFDWLNAVYDEPFADSSAFPTYRVCAIAKKNVTVALSGDGADEAIAGYTGYSKHMTIESINSYLPYNIRKIIFGGFGSIYPRMDNMPRIFRLKTVLQLLAKQTVEGYAIGSMITHNQIREKMYSEKLKNELQKYRVIDLFKETAKDAPSKQPLSLMQYLDMKLYLPGDILTKVDRASMAHSLEVRVPLLDHKLIEWLATIPPNLKLKNGESKYLLKKAMNSYLPKSILYRQKMGFSVPLSKWMRGPLKDVMSRALLNDSVLAQTDFFDMQYLRQIYNKHLSGSHDNSATLWALLMFDAFCRRKLKI